MTMFQTYFNSLSDVDEYVRLNGMARLQIEVGNMPPGTSKGWAEEWLKVVERKQVQAREDEHFRLAQRQTVAAEDSASAAKDSAAAAKAAVTWSRWAVVVALVALIATTAQWIASR